MCDALVSRTTAWTNAFPSKLNLSKLISLSGVVEGKNTPDLSMQRIRFGAYAIVFLKITHTMKHRSVPGIALEYSNNHGVHYFMSLYMGKRINSNQWKELPITEEVIERVGELGKLQDQPVMVDGFPVYEVRSGIQIEDELEYYENHGDSEIHDTKLDEE